MAKDAAVHDHPPNRANRIGERMPATRASVTLAVVHLRREVDRTKRMPAPISPARMSRRKVIGVLSPPQPPGRQGDEERGAGRRYQEEEEADQRAVHS